MSGTKTSRADLKNRFKKGMYPTEGDFANVFESYVHKDDDISMSKVVLTDGDGNTTTLNNVIGNKADKTDLTEITNRLTTAENDIDTAEDNIAGHETRIQGLEAFKERVRAFLEDADASEETINRWHEIESFLQGITDTQTLTGLLADLKQEILASIPEPQTGNYLKLVPDLDAYTDAPDGEIVKYTGPTTDQYTHGWDYERKAGTSTVTTFNVGTDPYTDSSKYLGIPEHAAAYLQYFPKNNQICTKTDRVLQVYKTVEDSDYFVFKDSHQVGDWFIFSTYAYPIDTMTEDEDTITAKGSDTRSVVFSKANVVSLPIWQTPNGKYIATITIGGYGYWIGLNDDGTPYCYGSCYNRGPETTETIDAPASWQPSKSMSVID